MYFKMFIFTIIGFVNGHWKWLYFVINMNFTMELFLKFERNWSTTIKILISNLFEFKSKLVGFYTFLNVLFF